MFKNLSVSIQSISANGILTLRFNDTLAYEGINMTYINSTNLNISIIPFIDSTTHNEINFTNLNFPWKVIFFT